MGNAILTKNLVKRYGSKTAVDSISLSVPEGEMIALLGVNGAGKTTTIRMLTCLSKPTEGSASILGHDVVKEADTVKRLVGISTQDTAVADNLTVEENLKFMAGVYLEKNQIDKNVENTIKIFSLEEYRNTDFATFFKNQSQKQSNENPQKSTTSNKNPNIIVIVGKFTNNNFVY